MPLPAQLRFLAALSDPQQASTWTLAEWQLAVHQGRRLRLLARLARALEAADLLGQVPEQPLRHLRAELHLSRWRTAALSWTQEQVGEALRPLGARAVLLKGAAYLAQELPNAPGRLPSDLDILLPREQLARAAELLQRAGWREKDLDEHDRRYYLEWSHELPPMHHPVLPLELDVHHNILPATRRLRIDAARLFDAVRSVGNGPWAVLAPADQLLHCAAHLFFDAEPRDRVRDLVDFDALLRHFGAVPGFDEGLVTRAAELGLREPLTLGLRFAAGWFDAPLPAPLRAAMAGGPRLVAVHGLMRRLILPGPPGEPAPPGQGVAAALVMARYQLDRLPPRVLAAHLLHRLRSRP